MPSFSDSFWSSDYAAGLNVLHGKLQQGITENQQLLTIASLRADAEELYSEKLGAIGPAADKLAGSGFARDDGASARKVGSILDHFVVLRSSLWLCFHASVRHHVHLISCRYKIDFGLFPRLLFIGLIVIFLFVYRLGV